MKIQILFIKDKRKTYFEILPQIIQQWEHSVILKIFKGNYRRIEEYYLQLQKMKKQILIGFLFLLTQADIIEKNQISQQKVPIQKISASFTQNLEQQVKYDQANNADKKYQQKKNNTYTQNPVNYNENNGAITLNNQTQKNQRNHVDEVISKQSENKQKQKGSTNQNQGQIKIDEQYINAINKKYSRNSDLNFNDRITINKYVSNTFANENIPINSKALRAEQLTIPKQIEPQFLLPSSNTNDKSFNLKNQDDFLMIKENKRPSKNQLTTVNENLQYATQLQKKLNQRIKDLQNQRKSILKQISNMKTNTGEKYKINDLQIRSQQLVNEIADKKKKVKQIQQQLAVSQENMGKLIKQSQNFDKKLKKVQVQVQKVNQQLTLSESNIKSMNMDEKNIETTIERTRQKIKKRDQVIAMLQKQIQQIKKQKEYEQYQLSRLINTQKSNPKVIQKIVKQIQLTKMNSLTPLKHQQEQLLTQSNVVSQKIFNLKNKVEILKSQLDANKNTILLSTKQLEQYTNKMQSVKNSVIEKNSNLNNSENQIENVNKQDNQKLKKSEQSLNNITKQLENQYNLLVKINKFLSQQKSSYKNNSVADLTQALQNEAILLPNPQPQYFKNAKKQLQNTDLY